MYEKYDAYEVGVGGGGGEYIPQVGFGWSNGVALALLAAKYSKNINNTSGKNTGLTQEEVIIITVVVIVVAFAIIGAVASIVYKKKNTEGENTDKISLDAFSPTATVSNPITNK